MGQPSANEYAQRDYSEKRDFHRMRLNTDIEIRFDDSNETISAHCINLSGTGLMFRTKEPLKEGSICYTQIKSGSETTADLDAKLKIIRCASNGPQGFLIGAEIVQFNS
jgi:hypothetical protein